MKNKLYKNKLLFLFLTFLNLILILSTKSFSSFDFSYDNENISINDLPFNTNEYPYYVINYRSSGYYQVAYTIDDCNGILFMGSNKEGNVKGCTYYIKGTTNQGQWMYFNLKDGVWSEGKQTKEYCCTTYSNGFKEGTIYYSSVDIYEDSSLNKIFFQGTPLVIITKVAQVEQILEIMIKIMKMIIPIGLVILLIGLVIYVVKLVILQAT